MHLEEKFTTNTKASLYAIELSYDSSHRNCSNLNAKYKVPFLSVGFVASFQTLCPAITSMFGQTISIASWLNILIWQFSEVKICKKASHFNSSCIPRWIVQKELVQQKQNNAAKRQLPIKVLQGLVTIFSCSTQNCRWQKYKSNSMRECDHTEKLESLYTRLTCRAHSVCKALLHSSKTS